MKEDSGLEEVASDSNHQTQNERKPLPLSTAIAMLPDGDTIHTFRNDSSWMMIGAGWTRKNIIEAITKHGCELSGPMAARMNHGLWVNDGQGRGLFVETRQK